MNAAAHEKTSIVRRALPGLTLMTLAPLIAEILPGATRMSIAWLVFPIQFIIWGGGAAVIREIVRRLRLGWFNMLLLAMALAIAEECLIQQTSFAPVVIKAQGVEYARAQGVNYVYFLWAMIYEAVFVVFVPIGLAELIFRRRREEPWLNAWGMAIIAILFLPACRAAWFGWTQIARVKVFHMDPYTPPFGHIAIAVAAIVVLIALAIGPARQRLVIASRKLEPPHPWVLFVLSGLAVVVLFGLDLLAFGIMPSFPPLLAVAIGAILVGLLVAFLPRFSAHEAWRVRHELGLFNGAIVTNMLVLFVAFRARRRSTCTAK